MLFFISALVALLISCSLGNPLLRKQCVPFDSEVCATIKYNHTCLSRGVDPENVEKRLRGYDLLIKSKCHPSLVKFLCFSYYPFCQPGLDEVPEVRPCRSLCLDVKEECLGLIEAAGFTWPQELNCSSYPVAGSVPCLEEEKEVKECRPCNLKGGRDVLRSTCSKEFSMYAHIKVLEQLQFNRTIAFKAQLLSLYRPRRFRGGEANGEVEEVTIITESKQDCPCVKLEVGSQYFVGGIYFGSTYKSLYILPNNAIIKGWNGGGTFGRKIKRCLTSVDNKTA